MTYLNTQQQNSEITKNLKKVFKRSPEGTSELLQSGIQITNKTENYRIIMEITENYNFFQELDDVYTNVSSVVAETLIQAADVSALKVYFKTSI